MLYPTHKRYGIFFGLMTFPIGVGLGVVPVLTGAMRASDVAMVLICSYMAMRGAIFGAEFPDIDSPGSIPAQKHPVIKKIFRFFGVKHRGKFSHDVFSQTMLFGSVYFLLTTASNRWLNNLVTASNFWLAATVLATLCFVWFVSLDLVDLFKWVANLGHNQRWWTILDKNRFKIGAWIGSVLTVLMMMSGVIDVLDAVFMQVSVSSALKSAMMLISAFKVYTVFALAGVYSHLFADMTTKAGISIFFIPLAPAKVILKLKKIPIIGKLLIPTEFRTGSKWEDFNRLVITCLCLPAFIIALYAVTGFQIFDVVDTSNVANK